jgi:hypothetical protein
MDFGNLIEFLMLGIFSIFAGGYMVKYWLDGGQNYMLITGILVIIMGITIIGGSFHFYRKRNLH